MTLYKQWITRQRGQTWALWMSVWAFVFLTIGWLAAIAFGAAFSIIE